LNNIAKIEVYLWWCQDEVCDCTQPMVDVILPNVYPFQSKALQRQNIWKGNFQSEYGGRLESEEYEQRDKELKAAAKLFNVTLNENNQGERQIRLDMCPSCGSNAWWLSSQHRCSSKDDNGNWVQLDPIKEINRIIEKFKNDI